MRKTPGKSVAAPAPSMPAPANAPGHRLPARSRHARGAPRERRDGTHARGGGDPPEGARLQRSGREEGPPVPHVSRQVLGPVRVDARADHRPVGRPQEVLGSRRRGRAADRQRRVELHAGASGRRRRGNAAAPAAGQCARPARGELAGHPRSGAGPRRHRSRATRRHHPGGREAPHGSVGRGPVGPHRRIEGRGQGARRSAFVGVRRPPRRGQRCRHADRGEDLLWPHHGARAGGATEAPHRSGRGQGRPLALRHRRRAAGRRGRSCRSSAEPRSWRWFPSCSCC